MLTRSRHSLQELFQMAEGNNDHINIHLHQLTKAEVLPLWTAEYPVCHFFCKSRNKLPSASVLPAAQYKAVQFPHQLLPCTRKISTGASFGYRSSQAGTTVSAPATAEHRDIQSLCIPELNSEEYLRTGQLQAYKDFFSSGLKGRYEYVWRQEG